MGQSGGNGLELRLQQQGSIITGYGDMTVGGLGFLGDVGGRINPDGQSILTLAPEDGSGYDELQVTVSFQGSNAQAAVSDENGNSLGLFTLTQQDTRAQLRQGSVLTKLWDNTLSPFSSISPPERYSLTFGSPGGATIDVQISGVLVSELAGSWSINTGQIHNGPFSPVTAGRVAAWNPFLLPGNSVIVLKDPSTINDLGQVKFARFSNGQAGSTKFSVTHPRDGIYAGSAGNFSSGTVSLTQP